MGEPHKSLSKLVKDSSRASHSRLQDLVAHLHNFIQEEVVEEAITPKDNDVPFIRGDAMHCTSLFYHFESNGLVKVIIYSAVHPC